MSPLLHSDMLCQSCVFQSKSNYVTKITQKDNVPLDRVSQEGQNWNHDTETSLIILSYVG